MNIKKIKTVMPPHPFEAYTHAISPLSSEEGGGFLTVHSFQGASFLPGPTLPEHPC